ncbi:4-coumarate-CoA ligase 2 [Sarocladium implicatum]|nr:4-coumarate-CoA ligase 2 [Sarocladium implicatum]
MIPPNARSKERLQPGISRKDQALPERVIIYHAGSGRVSFLAMFKVTSLLLGAFFCFAVAPAYYSSDKVDVGLESLGPALCGVVPVLLIAYTTAPFVTHMHLHLPPAARLSRPALERFVHGMPPSTPLTITTISAIGKPRYSNLQVGHLRPQRSRLGLVNYVRDHNDQENAARKWYNFRAVNNFYVQDDKAVATARKQSKAKKTPVEWWIWDAVRGKMAKRAAQENAAGPKV